MDNQIKEQKTIKFYDKPVTCPYDRIYFRLIFTYNSKKKCIQRH